MLRYRFYLFMIATGLDEGNVLATFWLGQIDVVGLNLFFGAEVV